jgi:TonB family protein
MGQGSLGKKSADEVRGGCGEGLRLLVELAPWHEVFLSNLTDLRDRFAVAPRPRLALVSPPGTFWPDVFVVSGPNWRRFLESMAGHLLGLGLILALAPIWPRSSTLALRSSSRPPDVVRYEPAATLPALNTGGRRKRIPRNGRPEHASQSLLSVTREADNRTQTIVVAPDLKLNRDVPLPNLIVASSPLPTVPLPVTRGALLDRKLAIAQAAVVAPQPQLDATSDRRIPAIDRARAPVVAPAPKLALDREQSAARHVSSLPTGSAAVVPPPPPVAAETRSNSGGILIALGLHPLAPDTPIEAPAGNRRGSFAASPKGQAGSSGQPDPSEGENRAGVSNQGTHGLPPGLEVKGDPQASAKRRRTAAALAPVRVDPGRTPSAASSATPTALEKQVFGDRKFYAMILNMPNLNSSGGSWVIHFAEFKPLAGKGDLSTPVPTKEVDPGYPAELMQHNIHGTVTLYAVIHRDGSVDGVRVLQGVDDRLDDYARAALLQWRFRPATKDGNAVDLDAVVMIPFRPAPKKPDF